MLQLSVACRAGIRGILNGVILLGCLSHQIDAAHAAAELSVLDWCFSGTVGATMLVDPSLCKIAIQSKVDSDSAVVGQVVAGTLKESLQMTETYNAPPGSVVLGKVSEIGSERTTARAIASTDRPFNSDGCLKIVFDEVICPDGARFQINGALAKQKSVIPLSSGDVRVIAVNSEGQLVRGKSALPTGDRIRNIVGQNAIGLATWPLKAASLVVRPVALGVAGAASPTFVSNRPADPAAVHPRLKGFAEGVVDGLPGSAVVQAFIRHGQNTGLLPGDQLIMSCIPVGGTNPSGAIQVRVHGVVLHSNEQPEIASH